jgi:type IV pilus assembly protein PilZ
MNERAPSRPAGMGQEAALPAGTTTVAVPVPGGTGTNVPSAPLTALNAVGSSAGATGGSGLAQAGRPSVIQLVFREKGALYAAYMPLLTDGGLFVPTTRDYRLGDDIYLLLSLPDDPQRFPVAGKVAWLTPANASGGRTQGVGVRFPNDDKTRQLKAKIEEILGTSISSAKPTQTL